MSALCVAILGIVLPPEPKILSLWSHLVRPLKHCGASWCVIGLWWASLELYDYRGVTQPGWFAFRVGFNPGEPLRSVIVRMELGREATGLCARP